MTREEILTKAIAIAKRNGYDISEDFFTEISTDVWLKQDLYFSLVFDHQFAKCFFLEDFIEVDGFDTEVTNISLLDTDNPVAALMINRKNIGISSWEFHLGQMVFSKDPLQYIENYILQNEQANAN